MGRADFLTFTITPGANPVIALHDPKVCLDYELTEEALRQIVNAPRNKATVIHLISKPGKDGDD